MFREQILIGSVERGNRAEQEGEVWKQGHLDVWTNGLKCHGFGCTLSTTGSDAALDTNWGVRLACDKSCGDYHQAPAHPPYLFDLRVIDPSLT